MASLARRLYFRSAIKKNWLPLSVSGGHGMVHTLVITSTLLMMLTITTIHTHALAATTLLLLQCRTRTQSWPGLSTSHLMRWRFFSLSLLNKYKENHFINYGQKTCSYINMPRVNSIYGGHCRDRELVSSLARVHNSGSLYQSNI